jgi:hypothetical protein
MGILSEQDITLLTGDIEAFKLEMERKITDLTTRVQHKVDCAPFHDLKDDLDRIFGRIDKMVELQQNQIYELKKEVVKLQQQTESILSILAIYNKSIKTE